MKRAAVLVLLIALAVGLLDLCTRRRTPPDRPAPPADAPPSPGDLDRSPAVRAPADCSGPPEFAAAAARNAATLSTLSWAPFRRAERGWEIYAPKITDEIETACPPASPGFAAALARRQAADGLTGDGVMSDATFAALKADWHAERPFRGQMRPNACPPPPPRSALVRAGPGEGYSGKEILLRPKALAAYRAMVAAAKKEAPEIAHDKTMLTIFSGWRDPGADAARCAREGNCNGVTRAACSAHRTGLVLDIVVGAAPGYGVDSSADANRLHQSRTAAYRWLVANADRFGFVNYVFEPWHWEYAGEPISAAQTEAGAAKGTRTPPAP